MNYLTSLRSLILIASGFLTAIIVAIIYSLPMAPQLQIIRLTQTFGFLSLLYLYFSLLISPLFVVFPKFPGRDKITDSRRAIGVSAFFFALLHSCVAFFGQLGGLRGIFFLSDIYLVDLSLSLTALIILIILALTSFDKIINKMTFPKWKLLHRLVYLSGLLILIHTFVLGTHFQDLTKIVPQIAFALLAFLGVLDAIRLDRYLSKRWKKMPKLGLSVTVVILLLFYCAYSFLPFAPPSLGIHSQHILLAEQAQNTKSNSSTPGYLGFTGDPSLRYTTSFIHDDVVMPGVPTTLHFRINNAATGLDTKLFSPVYSKTMHLIVVDQSLTYFSHIHPEQAENELSTTTTFPKEGVYHLYTDFQPLGAIEQQMAFTLTVGDNVDAPQVSSVTNSKSLTKQIDNYEISMNFQSPLKASELSVGKQKITFFIQDAETKKPITSLKPYLAAFGHLSMINERTFDFVHVHPFILTPPAPNATGGPSVEFLPLGIYGPIKPGIYRVFAEFNPDGNLITADFSIVIQ